MAIISHTPSMSGCMHAVFDAVSKKQMMTAPSLALCQQFTLE